MLPNDWTVHGKRKCNLQTSDLAYQWLEIRVEQHISIGVNGKIVAIWSKLQETGNREGDICEKKD